MCQVILGGVMITITDVLGKTVLNITAKQEDEIINTSSLNLGIYIVSVTGKKRLKLVKN